MRKYRDIGKTGISFLTAFASGHTLDQDATGEGFLLHPGLYTNLLLPYNEIEIANKYLLTPSIILNTNIDPNNVNSVTQPLTNFYTIGDYIPDERVLVPSLPNTKFNYEVYYEYEN